MPATRRGAFAVTLGGPARAAGAGHRLSMPLHIADDLVMMKLLFLVAVAGCHSSQTARPLAATVAAPAVMLCQTTAAELRNALGEPTRDGMFHDAHVMSWIIDERRGVVHHLAVLL